MTVRGSGPDIDALVDVEVETEGAEARDRGSSSRRPTSGRRFRLAVLGLGALVLAMALAATVTEVAAERDRRVRLAAVPGVVAAEADLHQPLEERWRQETPTDWVVRGEAGLVLVDSEAGVLRGVDQDGEPRWDVPLGPEASCVPLTDHEQLVGVPGYLSLAALLDHPVATVVCEQPGEGLRAWGTLDGSETGHLPYDSEVRTVAFLGTDLVVVTDDGDGGHRVRRWSPGSGVVHWEAPAPPPRRGLPWASWDLAVLDGVVLVRGEDTLRLDAESGQPTETADGSTPDLARERGHLDRSLVRVRVLEDGTEVVLQLRRADLPGTVLRRPGASPRRSTARCSSPCCPTSATAVSSWLPPRTRAGPRCRRTTSQRGGRRGARRYPSRALSSSSSRAGSSSWATPASLCWTAERVNGCGPPRALLTSPSLR